MVVLEIPSGVADIATDSWRFIDWKAARTFSAVYD